MRMISIIILTLIAIHPVSAMAHSFLSPFNGAETSGDWAADLVQVYQGQCSTLGDASAKAIGDNSILQGLIKEMATDPKCQGLTNNLSAIAQAQGQLALMLNNAPGAVGNSLYSIQSQVSQLSAAYGIATDPTQQAIIGSELAQAQANLYAFPAQIRINRQAQVFQTVVSLSSYVDSALNSLAANQACLQKVPGSGPQLVGQLTAISSGLVSGVAGPILEVGATAFNSLMNYIKTAHYAKQGRRVQAVPLGPAIGCAVEATARTYCHARDVWTLATNNSGPLQHTEHDPVWMGLSLTSTGLLEMTKWITTLVAASPATNQFSNNGVVFYNNLSTTLQNEVASMNAELPVFTLRDDAAMAPADKDNVREQLLKQLIVEMNRFVIDSSGSLSGLSSGGGGEYGIAKNSGFSNLFTQDANCLAYDYFRTGSLTPVSRPQVGGVPNCQTQYTSASIRPPDILTITQRMNSLIARAHVDVDTQVNQGLQIDSVSVLSAFDNGTSQLPAPRQAFKNIVFYFRSLLAGYGTRLPPNKAASVNQLINLLAQAARTVDNQALTADERVLAISSKLAPSRRESFISNRVEEIVRWDFQQRINDHSMDKSVKAIYQDNIQDSILLNKQLGSANLDNIEDDAATAKGMSLQNIGMIYSTFNRQIDDYADYLKAQVSQDPITWKANLRNFCAQLLAIPDIGIIAKDRHIMSACSGQIKPSAYSQANFSVDFDKQLANSNVESRVCALYDFFRDTRIFAIHRNQ